MAESIAVGCRPTGFLNTLHKFIVYTDSSGNQWVTSGFPEKNETKGNLYDLLPRGFPGSGSSQTDFGSIVTKGGTGNPRRYDSSYDDYPKKSDGSDRYTRNSIKFETVKIGENLSDDWKKVTDAMDAIAGEKRPYQPLYDNSNTTADDALRRAGIPLPKGDGFGENWAPGSGNNLPGGSGDAGGGGGGGGSDATAPGGIGGAGGAGGGGGRTESMEPGNTHWALMEWALESAEGTSREPAAKRICLDRRAPKLPVGD